MNKYQPTPLLPANLAFYASPVHECSYFTGREAITLFPDPHAPMGALVYSALAETGFRRSGNFVYRPQCPACRACIPARLPVAEFLSNRSQRRAWQRNQDLSVTILPTEYHKEHYLLYRDYIQSRHTGGGMDVDGPSCYMEFLASKWMETQFIEFRQQDGRLLMVAVIDMLENGLSAVYTFFDPKEIRRSLGTYAVLWQIEEARRQQLPHVYLGYWIDQSPQMAYKKNFQPLEIYTHGQWHKQG
ncbi:MAG: arginyltransferase [Thiohalomonadaceae bacterium]